MKSFNKVMNIIVLFHIRRIGAEKQNSKLKMAKRRDMAFFRGELSLRYSGTFGDIHYPYT